MRLFVAIELPADLRTEVADRMRSLAATLPPTRWVRPAALHLTLSFLGEVGSEAVPRLEETLGEAFARHRALELSLRDGGTFPAARPARVAWLGVDDDGGLAPLQSDVDQSARRTLQLPPESRPFHPHLTLGRPRRPWPAAATERWSAGLAGPLGDPFRAEHGTLVRSYLEPAGPRHEVMGEYPLTGGGE